MSEQDTVAEYSDFQHGMVCVPILLACRQKGILEYIQQHPGCKLDDLVWTNHGHLMVAVRALASIGVLEYGPGETVFYTAGAELSASIARMPGTLMELFNLDMHQCLISDGDTQLTQLANLLMERWAGVECSMVRAFLDGTVILPLLLALTQTGWIRDGGVDVSGASSSVRRMLVGIFKAKRWFESEAADFIQLSNQGAWITQRVLSSGVVVSYRPLLSQVETLLCGDPEVVFTRDIDGHEAHVDRTLNVVGSGFQHTRYFSAMKQLVVSIIQGSATGQRPRFIVDTGCGDGTLLCMLYEAIRELEAAGETPLVMVGVDFNQNSIAATTQKCTSKGVPLIAVQGEQRRVACVVIEGWCVNCRRHRQPCINYKGPPSGRHRHKCTANTSRSYVFGPRQTVHCTDIRTTGYRWCPVPRSVCSA